jgi:hypothetical protein
VTELEADKFRQVAPIDWARLARAHEFYERRGYLYVEVPWAVQRKIINITLPPGNVPILAGNDAVLVGSAEQGFLDLVDSKHLSRTIRPGRLLFSISPCFRGEPILTKGHTQLTFMKVELFCLEDDSVSDSKYERVSERLLLDAQEFMTTEGVVVTRESTQDGVDLYCSGLEVGSYGSREWNGYRWAYGTGLAEPRFSTALKWFQQNQQKFPFNYEVK